MDSDDEPINANPTRSGRIPTTTAKVANSIRALLPKKGHKEKIIRTSPSEESISEVRIFPYSVYL